jgi:hypothetical protein
MHTIQKKRKKKKLAIASLGDAHDCGQLSEPLWLDAGAPVLSRRV